MAQGRPDLSAAAKIMPQHMSKPREGVLPVLKRCVRYLKKVSAAALLLPRGLPDDDRDVVAWKDKDWARDPVLDGRRAEASSHIEGQR